MPSKPAPGAATLGRAALAGWLLLGLQPVRADDVALQAELAGREYVLVERASGWSLVEQGDPVALPEGRELLASALAALDEGWLLAGHRAAAEGPGRELVLLRGRGGGLEALPVPPAGTRTLMDPAPLIENGSLVGLAWLEGEDSSSLGIRAAPWSQGGFAPAEWVSEPKEGSQLALAATVLNDGTWLLVWSAFDGQDDEVLHSRRVGSSWTAPARIHADNQVPDITPVVAATPSGAVAAWSRYEAGHYRVRVSRWNGSSWSGEQRVGGPGSVFPFFVQLGDGRAPHLAFPAVASESWDLLELGAAGEVRARTRWPGPPGARPLVRRTGRGAARLEWPFPAEPLPDGGERR